MRHIYFISRLQQRDAHTLLLSPSAQRALVALSKVTTDDFRQLNLKRTKALVPACDIGDTYLVRWIECPSLSSWLGTRDLVFVRRWNIICTVVIWSELDRTSRAAGRRIVFILSCNVYT